MCLQQARRSKKPIFLKVAQLAAAAGVAMLAACLEISGAMGLYAGTASAQSSAGQWVNVTPAGVDLTNELSCGNYGTQSVVVDPDRPSDLYAQFNCQGIWKSTDYGQTWTGNIATGTNSSAATNCAGAISIASGGGGANPATLYETCIRGTYVGFLASTDGGVNWTTHDIGPAHYASSVGNRQDVYQPAVDPYDPMHLIVDGHELNAIYESSDGGETWTSVPIASGMSTNGGSAFTFFVNTGAASTTRGTLLYEAQATGGQTGTWRTTNDGASWTRVDSTEHQHGAAQVYQPDATGVMFEAGVYNNGGWGVSRSTDFGRTWTHVGNAQTESTVYGTPNNVYAEYSSACGLSCNEPWNLIVVPAPGNGAWSNISQPARSSEGSAHAAVTFDGSSYDIVTANWQSGLWRYVEPPAHAGVAATSEPEGSNESSVPASGQKTSAAGQ
jgi:hypothetical protein